jgi:HAD superfamily hydrolase (TIGR01548 family)
MKPLLVFDMDGVLVDVKESYRETIRATVKHFCGTEVTHEEIQHYKNLGGYNNDWLLSQRLCQEKGRNLAYQEVVDVFNQYFFGVGDQPGLMEREKWIPGPGLLDRLNERYELAIFTGRLHEEAQITLRRFTPGFPWFAVLGDDNVARSKPDPDGLLQLLAQGPVAYYIGDSVDDAKAARDADLPFIAITAPGGDFTGLPVKHAIPNINELETVL